MMLVESWCQSNSSYLRECVVDVQTDGNNILLGPYGLVRELVHENEKYLQEDFDRFGNWGCASAYLEATTAQTEVALVGISAHVLLLPFWWPLSDVYGYFGDRLMLEQLQTPDHKIYMDKFSQDYLLSPLKSVKQK